MISSLIVAFSMYSRIPMPKVTWDDDNMGHAMCFFPLVGAVVGILYFVMWHICKNVGFTGMATGVILLSVPIAIAGGIHVDGFMDTMDALGSHQGRERKLEILKDSHTGAFAVLGCVIYFLAVFGFTSDAAASGADSIAPVAALGFILSRAYSGLSVVAFRSARKGGMLDSFAGRAKKRKVRNAMLIWIVAASAAMIILNPPCGMAAAVAAMAMFLIYGRMCDRQFGGTTGDLAGFFLLICELAQLIAAVVVWHILAS